MRKHPRGVALVTAMFVVLVLYFLCTVAAREAQENLRYLTLESERTRRFYLAKAGVNQAVAEMMQDLSNEAAYDPANPLQVEYDGIVVRTWVEPDPNEASLRHVHAEAFPLGRPGEVQRYTRVVRRSDVALNAILYFRKPNSNEMMVSQLADEGLDPQWASPLPSPTGGASPNPQQYKGLDGLPEVPHLVYAPTLPYGTLEPSPLPSPGPVQGSLMCCTFDSETETLYAFTRDPAGVGWPGMLKKDPDSGTWLPVAPLPPSPGPSPCPMLKCGPVAAAGQIIYAVCQPGGPSPGPPELYKLDTQQTTPSWTKLRDLTSAAVALSAYSIPSDDKKGVLLSAAPGTWELIGDPIDIDVDWGEDTCWVPNPDVTADLDEEPLVMSGGAVQETQKSICANGDVVALWKRSGVDSVLQYSRVDDKPFLQKFILFPPKAAESLPRVGGLSGFRLRLPWKREKYISDIEAVYPTPVGEPIYEFRYGSGRYLGMRNTKPRAIPLGYDLECAGATSTGEGPPAGQPQVVPVGSL